MVKPFIYWVSTYVFVEIRLWKSTSQLGTRLFTRLLCMSITKRIPPCTTSLSKGSYSWNQRQLLQICSFRTYHRRRVIEYYLHVFWILILLRLLRSLPQQLLALTWLLLVELVMFAHWIYQNSMSMSWPETTEHTNVLLMAQGLRNEISFYSKP